MVSSVPPKRCGIALYACELTTALEGAAGQGIAISWVPVMGTSSAASVGPIVAALRGSGDTAGSALAAAMKVNRTSADVVWVQHEFGLYGRWQMPYRHSLGVFLGALRRPVVTTLHTVLSEPPANVRRVVQRISTFSAQLIVMSSQAAYALHDVYRVSAPTVSVIPHGVRVVPDSAGTRPDCGDHPGILSFGLISPGKGLHNVIRALPAVAARWPGVRYTIAGQSHPSLSRADSAGYRATLHRLAAQLGVAPNVRFENRFLSNAELDSLLVAADLVVVANADPQQVSSGTLARAVGAGGAVLAVPNGHSRDLAALGAVRLLSDATPTAIAAATIDLLSQPQQRAELRERARRYGVAHSWDVMAHRYAHLLEIARRGAP
jgi:glycosyltransferase involved in cell wall biosynthesis